MAKFHIITWSHSSFKTLYRKTFKYHGRSFFNPEFVIFSNLNFQVPAADERADHMKEAREQI